MSITLVRLLPDTLNLNGSLGNAEVLATRMRWWGVDVAVTDVNRGDKLGDAPDLVVIGHGTSSMVTPAGAELGRWRDTLRGWAESGTHWFGAGLGGDLLGESVALDATAPRIPGLGLTGVHTTLRANRASTEVSGLDYRGREVAGYLNDAALRETSDAAPLLSFLPVPNDTWQGGNGEQGEGVQSERLWATAVSGPFLALNPHVADDIIGSVLASRGISLPELTEAHSRVDSAAETARAWIRSRLGGA